MSSGAETAQLITASVAQPAAKLLRTDVALPFSNEVEDDLALAGDRVAVRRPGPKDYALVDLATGDIAATVDRYEPNPCASEGFGIDWDGTRLAWVNKGIRNELQPTTPSTPGPADRSRPRARRRTTAPRRATTDRSRRARPSAGVAARAHLDGRPSRARPPSAAACPSSRAASCAPPRSCSRPSTAGWAR